ncbi:hypothetical protein F4680DRAFT_266528 [Xylaria scruposa]|nr:hypothetical protein F4680DRAFT_266528 [Xylaria scruposa]
MASSDMHAQLRPPHETTISLPENIFVKLFELEEENSITFLHPCGPKGHCVLFCLPALDIGIPGQPVWALDHQVARFACGILAGNRWDGYFMYFSGQRVEKTTKLLLEPRYFFILPDTFNESPTKKDGRDREQLWTEDNTFDSTGCSDCEATGENICSNIKRNLSPAMEERGRTLKRRCNTATRSSSVRTSSTVTSAGARTPTSSEDNEGQYGQYSYHISSTAPTKEEAWENEEVWQRRQRRRRDS